MGAAGGLPLPIRGPSGFFKFHFSPWFSKLSVALRSSLLGSAPTSSPLPPGHTRSFPPTLPSSKYVAVFPDGSEQRQGSRPHPFRRLRRYPTLFRLKSKHRCLTCTLQTGEGAQRRAPLPTPAPLPPASRAAGSKHRPGTTGPVSLPRLCFFLFSVSFSWKRKAVSGERLARACLGVQVGVWDPFLPGKEREGGEQTRGQLLLATHCAVSSEATLLPHPVFFP